MVRSKVQSKVKSTYVLRSGIVNPTFGVEKLPNGKIAYHPNHKLASLDKEKILQYLEKMLPTPEHCKYRVSTPEEIDRQSRPYAEKALRSINWKSSTKYEIVDVGRVHSSPGSKGCYHHMNFQVKSKDDADAPVLLYFVELRSIKNNLPRVTFKECLGPIDSLPAEKSNHGCMRCAPGVFHHPASQGFNRGVFKGFGF